jgi:hypothetical protein
MFRSRQCLGFVATETLFNDQRDYSSKKRQINHERCLACKTISIVLFAFYSLVSYLASHRRERSHSNSEASERSCHSIGGYCLEFVVGVPHIVFRTAIAAPQTCRVATHTLFRFLQFVSKLGQLQRRPTKEATKIENSTACSQREAATTIDARRRVGGVLEEIRMVCSVLRSSVCSLH